MNEIKLTQFSHGAGCGCKIAPAMLETILHTSAIPMKNERLLVGNETKDDAAVFDLDGNQCIISTTDFFMPIVDDATDFGRIASVNAISDVYAMGGKPLMAIAILGWPIGKLPPELAQRVLEGSRAICAEAGIPLAGGHSIDSPEPIFGLAVTGVTQKSHIKRNDTAKAGDLLYLTKPLGVGIITTAQKRGLAEPADLEEAVRVMTQLNKVGAELGLIPSVTAMTDVTGFGLLGHLIEMCEGGGVSAEISYPEVPLLNNLRFYTGKMIYPDNTMRNWSSYQEKVEGIGSESLLTLCDPQTSGGLLISVAPSATESVEDVLRHQGLPVHCIGKLITRGEKLVIVKAG
jgi:selenide,water dikinase